MLLFATLALAAPLAPSTLPGSGVEVSVYTGGQTAWLREPDCIGDACDAWRVDTLVGGEVGVGLLEGFGLYGHGAHVTETVDAAQYTAEGYAFGGGLRGSLPLGALVGLDGWLGVEHQFTAGGDLTEQATAWQLDGGVVLRGGAAREGFQGWIGAGFVPWSAQSATVLDGAVTVGLTPRVPVEAVAGFQLVSEPLFGPWDTRTRLSAGLSGALGYRSGLTGFLTVLR